MLDEFADFLDVDLAANEFHFLAVAIHQHAGREAALETDFASRLAAAEQNGEIDLARRAIDRKRLVLDITLDRFLALVIHGERHNGESRGFELLLQLD